MQYMKPTGVTHSHTFQRYVLNNLYWFGDFDHLQTCMLAGIGFIWLSSSEPDWSLYTGIMIVSHLQVISL